MPPAVPVSMLGQGFFVRARRFAVPFRSSQCIHVPHVGRVGQLAVAGLLFVQISSRSIAAS